jgi:hypothetical protein
MPDGAQMIHGRILNEPRPGERRRRMPMRGAARGAGALLRLVVVAAAGAAGMAVATRGLPDRGRAASRPVAVTAGGRWPAWSCSR